jgi:hypothetical protein
MRRVVKLTVLKLAWEEVFFIQAKLDIKCVHCTVTILFPYLFCNQSSACTLQDQFKELLIKVILHLACRSFNFQYTIKGEIKT